MRSEREKKERLKFIDTLVEYNRAHSNEEWGKEHVKFINSTLKNANQDKELFLKTHPERNYSQRIRTEKK